MVERLLPDLKTTPATGRLENLEEQAEGFELVWRALVRGVGAVVEEAKGSGGRLEESWRRIVLAVARGETEVAHAQREQLQAGVCASLEFFKRLFKLEAMIRPRLRKEEALDLDPLLPEVAALERFKSTVLDRWQTAEDLEDLAARDYPLSTTELDQIGPTRRPPSSWYSDESKPF
jgi:hypothetical protein